MCVWGLNIVTKLCLLRDLLFTQYGQFYDTDLSVDIFGRASYSVHGEQVTIDRDTEELFIGFEIWADELPILLGQLCETTAIQLFRYKLVVGVPYVNCAAGGEREKI